MFSIDYNNEFQDENQDINDCCGDNDNVCPYCDELILYILNQHV